MRKQVEREIKRGENKMSKKILVNIGDHRKAWIESVAQKANCAEAEVMRAIIDLAANHDPESFVSQMNKIQLRAKLKDLEDRKQKIQAEEDQLMRELEQKGMRKEETAAIK